MNVCVRAAAGAPIAGAEVWLGAAALQQEALRRDRVAELLRLAKAGTGSGGGRGPVTDAKGCATFAKVPMLAGLKVHAADAVGRDGGAQVALPGAADRVRCDGVLRCAILRSCISRAPRRQEPRSVRWVIPHELVRTAQIPGGGELRCYRHDDAYLIRVDGIELMSSRVHGSEEELAELALKRLGRTSPRVLIGGLGMGYTLARTLQLVDEHAVVEVAEISPEIVEWNRDVFGHCAGDPLKDPRAKVLMSDVAERIGSVNGLYDAMLLDVDNGPNGLVRPDNDRIYSANGLERAHKALRPGGVLAVWSARSDDRFADRLRRGSFDVVEHRVRARRTRGPVRTIWVGARR